MLMPSRKKLIRAALIGVMFAALIIGAAMGTFVLAFGWSRFLQDFWPLDDSRVGPNLCASLFIIVLLIGRDVYTKVSEGELRGESFRQITRDIESDVLHPIDELEKATAEEVVSLQRQEQHDDTNDTTTP